jgi:hypothetical protein
MHNPQAFPANFGKDGWEAGMELRDYFASKAIQGILSTYPFSVYDMRVNRRESAWEFQASVAYSIADAMLAARTRNQ